MSSIIDFLMSVSGPVLYIVIGLLAFSEAAAFVGLVLPGETALFIGGVLASQGHVNLGIMLTVAVVAAVAGDSVGYEIGRRFGPSLKNSRAGRFVGADKWAKGEQFLARRGGTAVLLGRWVGLLRALVPAIAGMARMPYKTFLLYNTIGGTIWAVTVVLLGYFAGQSYKTVEQYLGKASLILTLVIAGALIIALIARFALRNPRWTRRRVAKLKTLPAVSALTVTTTSAQAVTSATPPDATLPDATLPDTTLPGTPSMDGAVPTGDSGVAVDDTVARHRERVDKQFSSPLPATTERELRSARASSPSAGILRRPVGGVRTLRTAWIRRVMSLIMSVVGLVAVYSIASSTTSGRQLLGAVNTPVRRWLLDHQDDEFTVLMNALTVIGHPIVALCVLGVCIILTRGAVVTHPITYSLVLTGSTVAATVLSGVALLLIRADTNSFHGLSVVSPAGQTLLTAGLLTGAAWLLARRYTDHWRTSVIIIASLSAITPLIALSHAYLAEQDPLDITVGWLLGTLFAAALALTWPTRRTTETLPA